VVPGQVDQLAADLESGQAKELARAGGSDGAEGSAEANHRALENVVGLLPLPEPAVGVKHPPRQPAEARAGGCE
jgi:hypothetical protein